MSSSGSVSFLRILRVFKIMRIVKFRKTLKNAHRGMRSSEPELYAKKMSRVKRQAIFLTISLFATLFISAGIITFIQEMFDEAFTKYMDFDEALYFVVITSTTIGYGDIYPLRDESRLVTAIMLVAILSIFGDQISKLISIINESDRYDVKYLLENHVVVFNHKSVKVLTEFLLDYLNYNPDSKILVIDDA